MKIKSSKILPILYIIIVLLAIFSFLYIAANTPRQLKLQVKENNSIENSTFTFFALGFIIGIHQLGKLSDKYIKFAFLPIPLISLLLFLEEVGYGGRFFDIKYPRLHKLKFDGLHDVAHVLAHSYKRGEFPQVIDYISSSLFLPVLLFYFPLLVIIYHIFTLMRTTDQASRSRALFKVYLLLTAFSTLHTLISLFIIPSYSITIGIISFSTTRLAMMLFFAGLFLLCIYGILQIYQQNPRAHLVIDYLEANIIQKPITRVLFILFLAFIYFLTWILIFILPLEVDAIVYIRLAVLLLWLSAASFSTALLIFLWPVNAYPELKQAVTYGVKHLIAYRYIAFATLLILVAQIYDVNVWAIKYRIDPEEYLEMLAGFSFLFAALAIQSVQVAE
ncbi:MAG: hypothetical protein N2D54_10085 [Chloroflexota bacterium]